MRAGRADISDSLAPTAPPTQDNQLRTSVGKHGGRNWKQIAVDLPLKTDVQCLHRWQKVLNPDLVRCMLPANYSAQRRSASAAQQQQHPHDCCDVPTIAAVATTSSR